MNAIKIYCLFSFLKRQFYVDMYLKNLKMNPMKMNRMNVKHRVEIYKSL
jgi:hypothetical protein